LSQSVSDVVFSSSSSVLSRKKLANKNVLRLWVSLVTNGVTPVGVHEQLSNALIAVLASAQRQQLSTTTPSSLQLQQDVSKFLVQDWKQHLLRRDTTTVNNSNNNNNSKIASFRCATVLIRMVSRWSRPHREQTETQRGLILETARTSGGLGLLLQMLRDFDDPLQQLGLLDALVEEFEIDNDREIDNEHNDRGNATGATTSTPDSSARSASASTSSASTTAEWMASPELMSLVLQFLKDPLLCDAALRYVGVLSTMKPNELSIILDHVRTICLERGGSPPNRDSERLPLVRAISGAACCAYANTNAIATVGSNTNTRSPNNDNALDTILADPLLRKAWWDVSRVSQPKLQAAILVSVATSLPKIAAATSPASAIELYRCLGTDNSSGATTTQWLVDKFATSTFLEPRIASHALLAAILRVPNAGLAVFAPDPSATRALVQEVLLPNNDDDGDDGNKQNTTADSQRARFDLLESFLERCSSEDCCNYVDAKTLRRLQENRAMGPYGKKPRPYGADDVALA